MKRSGEARGFVPTNILESRYCYQAFEFDPAYHS